MAVELMTVNDVIVTTEQVEDSKDLLKETRDFRRWTFKLEDEAGSSVPLTENLSELLRAIIQVAARGGRTTFTSLPEMLSSAAAATMLGVSRPTLMKMVREGKIAATFVGTHARLKTDDVQQLAERRMSERADAFADLRQLTENLDLG